jgi:transposase
MRSKGTSVELEQRRRLAIRRIQEGWRSKDVAAFLGVTERTVCRWLTAFRAHGADGLKAKPNAGPAPYLTPAQERQVLGWLLQKPSAFGFASELWTSRRLAQLIDQRFGVRYNANYLCAWLAERGFTPQKPTVQARERDPEAIDHWRGAVWPALKKKRKRSRRTSC